MQSTKQQILDLLKRTGGVTVEEVSGALAVASMTARQHLFSLERDGVIRSDKVRRSTGRPHFVYSLTPRGEEMFPRRYDLLAQILLEEATLITATEIEGLDAAARRESLVYRIAGRLAERYRFPASRPLADRVAAATNVLQVIGGFAEWSPTGEGYEIKDYNCVFASLIQEKPGSCAMHTHFLSELVMQPVQHLHVYDGKVRCCHYTIANQPAEKKET